MTSVDKANVLATSVLVAADGDAPGGEATGTRRSIICTSIMPRCRSSCGPQQFDVLLTSNLFGDIFSDEAAALVGSIGMVPSWSAGDGPPLVEPIHGSAPQLVGKDLANPVGHNSVHQPAAARALRRARGCRVIERALDAVLAEGVRTPISPSRARRW